jgi:pilus assembly protein FimV
MVRKTSIYFSLITLIMLLPGQLWSLGLGEIEVDSALNQPLNAQINLISARVDELEEMRVELAPANVFDRVGVPRPYFLTQLKFKPVSLPGGGTAIRVTSKDPVREPFLTFLVEVTWPKGRLLREYTVLLDPPEFAQQQAPQIATPVTAPVTQESAVQKQIVEAESLAQSQVANQEEAVAENVNNLPANTADDLEEIRAQMDRKLGIDSSEPAVRNSVASTEEAPSAEAIEETVVETVATPQPVDVVVPEDIPGSEEVETNTSVEIAETEDVVSGSEVDSEAPVTDEYVVKGGDTLHKIVKAAKPSNALSTNQMMIAIQQANPNAFIKNNINLIKKGAVLRIPDADDVGSISNADARKQIAQQNALWREYRGQVSQTVATNLDAPELVKEKSDVAKQAKETLKEAIKKPERTKQDLNILAEKDAKQTRGNTQVAGGEELKKLQNEVTLTKELAESRAKEAEELKSRVEALESMLEKKEKILNIQNQQLKDLQQQLSSETDKAAAAEKKLQERAVKEEAKPEIKPETKPVVKEIKKPIVEPLPDFSESLVAEKPINKPRVEPLPDWDSLPEIEPVKDAVVAEAKPTEKPAEVKPEVAKPEQKPVVKKPEIKQVETPKTPETDSGILGFLQPFKEYAQKAGIGLGVLAALLGLFLWRKKRAVKTIELTGLGEMPLDINEDDEHFDDILDETIVTPQKNANETVTEANLGAMEDFSADDTDYSSAPIGATVGGSELGEDVLDEADVYISYGLHQQAQDLLTDAIAKEPNRSEYKVKLAEVYYSQKDQKGFEQYAEKIKNEVGESSSHWKNIMAMGKELAPSSALFAGAVGAATKAAFDKPEQADVDIGLQTVIDNPLSDANLEDTILDNDAEDDNGLDFNIDDPAKEDAFEDDPVASKIMQANETSDILNFEVDDLSDDEFNADDADTEIGAMATGLHETASMEDLTQELEQIGMQTTMNDLKPLDLNEDDLNAPDDTVAMSSDGLDIDTSITPADAAETAAYTSNTLADVLDGDDTEQFDVSNMDTEFLDPAEQTVAQTHTDLAELGPPSLIEEVGTKLDLAKAFVDMGDSEAAKETLLEVINEGDESQIKAAKDLMDKLGN